LLKALFVVTGLEKGGAEQQLYLLMSRLSHMEVGVAAVSLRGTGWYGARLREAGIEVTALDLPSFASMISAVPALRRAVARFNPDLIQGWMYHGNLLATLGASLPWRPLAWGIRQSIRQSMGDGVRERRGTRVAIRLGRALSHRPVATIYNSHAARRDHVDFGYTSVGATVIANGLDVDALARSDVQRIATRKALGIVEDNPLVLNVARWHASKDHATLLAAAAQVVARQPKVRFALVGSGLDPSNVELARILETRGLGSKVLLLGSRTDMPGLYSAADIFCLSSSAEAWPNVVGEAMAFGLPSVCTAVGEVPLIMGSTGTLVPPRDPQALVDGLLAELDRPPAARLEAGARARERIATQFSTEAMARSYAELYDTQIKARVR
jgi:glycosyltransferase involved in cell wall biosynthesis